MKTSESLQVAATATGRQIPAALVSIPKDGLIVPPKPFDVRGNMGKQPSIRLGAGITDANKIATPLVIHVCGFRTVRQIRLSEQYKNPCDVSQLLGIATIEGNNAFICLTLSSSSSSAAEEAMGLLELKGGKLANIVSVTIKNAKSKKEGFDFGIAEFGFRKATESEIGMMIDLFEVRPNADTDFLPLRNIDETIDTETGEVK